MLTIIAFLVLLTILVFVHEWGHYIVARRCGVRVEVFSIGFGREIYGWSDDHGTRWKISMIPLGGYVKFFGDVNAASLPDEATEQMSEEEKAVAFPLKPLRQRGLCVGLQRRRPQSRRPRPRKRGVQRHRNLGRQ